ncbi:MAG: thioredoxin-like domain-containing protein [Acidobacteriota bacterium]
MKKLLSLLIAITTLCSISMAQKVPVHGRVLSNEGKLLIKAVAELYDEDTDKYTQIEVSKDGSFSLPTTKKFLQLRLSGVNHSSMFLPIVIHEAKELEFDLLLATNTYTGDLSKVKLIGNFNNWSRENPVNLQKNEKGIYYADIDTDKDTVEYQLVGLSKTSESHSWNGTMSDDFKYDNGGDFKSVIYKKGKTAHIEFDPAKLIAQNPEAKLTSRNESLPEIIIMQEMVSYSNNLNRMHMERSDNPEKKPDFSKVIGGLKEKAYSEKNDYLKGFYSISYLKYWPYIERSNLDTVICQKTLEIVPPESDLWMLNPNLIMVASMCFRNKEKVFEKYVKEVADKQQNVAVKAEALRGLIYGAKVKGDTASFNSYIKKLINECPDTYQAKSVKSEFLTLRIGSDVPDFEVNSLADGNLTYSNKSLLGKFYLIDFWATWCGPCVGELPNLHEAYKEFKDKNFEILSISLDAKRQDVEKFRKEKFEMPWLHAFLDKGFGNDMTQKFGVTGIPKVVLVSDKGKILAVDVEVRGAKLKETLRKYLGSTAEVKKN